MWHQAAESISRFHEGDIHGVELRRIPRQRAAAIAAR